MVDAESGMNKLLDKYDDFAEDHPWLFLLSAAVVGIVVGLCIWAWVL
jgi:ElaB/YqjD/DUF883 family membrane-anchored ribosome-binding protein